jgi:3-deoxy-D-manno-octulosonate 8-phosphate phosphatase (KDO 8-P phosphatase)
MGAIDYAAIDLLVLDVDGVLTDGRITFIDSGQEVKSFHVRDGTGMKYWKRCGHKLAIISGRSSPAIERRAAELGVDALRMDAKDKLPAYREILDELRCGSDRVAVVGDDLPDLPLLRRCALPVAVNDAAPEVRGVSAVITRASGGAGAVREVIELILKKTGQWDTILARYLAAPADAAGAERHKGPGQ